MMSQRLSDEALLSRLHACCGIARRVDVRLIVHLIEVEERRLHLKLACSSLFDFCRRRLNMSEGAAFRRINAARLAARFPALLAHLQRGATHLSTLVLLRDFLTAENVDELVAATSGKTKREVQELLVARAPRPDVPSLLRKLPAVRAGAQQPALMLGSSVAPAPAPRLEPLSPERYKLQLTASVELRDKLERARELMRHRNPSGDLAVVVEQALDALLEKLERERLGKTTRPPRNARPAKEGAITAAVRREVFARDGEQCTFVDPEGRRCPARGFLELDHIEARARGGSGAASNIRVRCKSHNLRHAEEVFGREHVETKIRIRQRKCGEAAAPAAEDDSPFELATRGLVNLGFAKGEVARAVDVARQREPGLREAADVLRGALRMLT